jgi:hypothetical protein
VPDRPQPAITPEMHRARFEELAAAFTQGEFDRVNEDGSLTRVVSYERHVDPLDRGDLALMREFRLRAAALGYREAFSPLVLPTQQIPEPGQSVAITGDYYLSRPLTFVQFGYEKKPATPVSQASGPPKRPR